MLFTKESDASSTPLDLARAPADASPNEEMDLAVLDGDTADDTAGTAADAKTTGKTDGVDQDGKAVDASKKDDLLKQTYMTGLPFVITFGSLLLATLLSALNASMISTASGRTGFA